ncbi:carbonic anhydrase family protein [Serratia ureilytica]|uniref:carbonic anhydrase family protein n=2 Tax=Enterobacterales TaxID=91347 RepID=UPI00235F8A11|nr:carbonic anhydrase family protein [Serratia ureilytica]
MKKDTVLHASRRTMLKQTLAISGMMITGAAALTVPGMSFAASMSREERDRMTPDAVIAYLKQGNSRFRTNNSLQHDYIAQKTTSASGQYPAAVILSCIDSRAPAEIILDTGIGEIFNSRIAGNISNSDILGSLEFACASAGAKVILVMGHTACGAIKGAIDNIELSHLTGLLDKIKPAIVNTNYSGDRVSSNDDFVDAVAKRNVEMTVQHIREKSQLLKHMEDEKKIKIVGSMYNLQNGSIEFF